MEGSTRRLVLVGVFVLLATQLASALAALLIGWTLATERTDPFDQRAFPCQEDEVLAYAPQFGPGKVGCVHSDDR